MTEGSGLSWPAPAKINLFVHVLGKRTDGYHDIQTLFQLLDWGDEVQIYPTRDSGITRLPVAYDVPEDEDLVVRAARLLQSATGVRRGAEIGVLKRIPPGSGMGGGSSNAATVLLVLNRLWGCGLNLEELAVLGRRLGADVPVFVRGHSAMATGVGECLEPVSLGRQHYVLIFPGFPISTHEVFSDPDLARDSRAISLAQALAGQGRNDFEPVVCRRFPAFADLLESLRQWGVPAMTGTGSGVFIRVRDKKSAINAAQAMKSLYNVRAVRGVDRSPVHETLDSR